MPPVPDALSVVFRAISFVLLLQATGIAIFIAVFGRFLAGCRSLAATRRLGLRVALAAAACVTAHYLLEGGRMAGEMSGVIDPAMQMMALRSTTGAAFALRVLGLALVAIGLRKFLRESMPVTA